MSDYMRNRKTLSSVADAYREMYATPNEDILNEELIDSLIEDVRDEEINEWLDYLEEDGIMSYPKKNEKKIRPMLMKVAKKHPRVKVSFGTHSKGKFVDDNNINFKGKDKDVDALLKDIQNNHKNLVKMMEDNDLDESKGLAAKAKKSGISVGTLRKVYNRGMAAWKTGHRPGTTPQQWGMARVNAFIVKKKKGNLNHDKDLAHVIHPDDNMLEALTTMPDSVKDRISNLRNKKMDVKYDSDEYHRIQKQIDSLMRQYRKESLDDNMLESLQELESLLEKAYDKADVKKVQGLEKKLKNMLKEVDKVMRGSGLSAPAFSNVRSGISKGLESIQKFYKIAKLSKESMDEALKPHEKIISKTFKTTNKIEIKGIDRLIDMSSIGVVQAMQKQNPRGFTKTVMNLGKLKEDFESLDEVTRQEVDAMKRVSKDMQKVLVSYQKIANMGDKELKDTKHNKEYKKVLDARDTILKMIGTLNTKMILQKEELDNDDKPVVKKIVTMLKKASKKHAKQADDLEKAVSEGKGKNFAQQAAIAIAKKKSGKYDKDGKKIDERVKDGKLDPLSKMGKSKLTGQEINKYYRDNPKQKAAARDKTVKKAIELALDLSGATNYAIKEIEKLKRGLSKNPAVKLALRHANESKEFTGHHVVIENLSPANMVKLKTYGKMMAKMTKLPFDENDPEKGIDKLMGQVWKQKHVPANWERLHKMVMMLKGIGVKMPSLKGKYMGLDPVSKKAIFYKEGTDEMVEWHQKIEDIKEGIEELVEKKEMSAADIKKIAQMTDRNDHTGSLMHLAKLLGDRKGLDALKGIMMTHKALGHMPDGLMRTRNQIHDNLMRQSSSKYSNHKDVIRQF